ncbi:phospholipid-translocating ATPase [Vigna unguiculata]|uniref:Phospholipid-translocating ATPase n=1 Tax=Vigna unguiculata TaxID=3917 RepID=A0A4D6NNL6_VIGUN|nr:phospholipid-translocating ATPase [Vigna unguiculata]
MGRHSCCYKQKLRKGLWSPVEDEKLLDYITKHGHGCWSSVPKLICYFFYKNIAFGLTLFWFEAYASLSGQVAYNDGYMSFYNVFFTSLPVIALGVFDQDVSAKLCLKNIEEPEDRHTILLIRQELYTFLLYGIFILPVYLGAFELNT